VWFESVRPAAGAVTSEPSSSISGVSVQPVCVVPSIVRASVTSGSAVAGWMVWTPAPGMAKAIASVPALPLASVMAWRSEPAPESAVVVTVKVAAGERRAARRRAATAGTGGRRSMRARTAPEE
jgi:hypothetical protein